MQSLTATFDEVMERVRQGRALSHASFEPVYYLIFHPRQILEVQRELPAWVHRLRNDGWDVQRFSIAAHVAAILGAAPLRRLWLAADRKAPLDWEKTNKALANALTTGPDTLQARLTAHLEQLRDHPKAIMLVTDLEALHPYTRIGAIESQLYGAFAVPTIFFYPGERTGKTRLKFLGFYPEDGNYRSVHVGG
ncbi:MAG: BREX protein BrxB domain-containing protein [Chloroflexales bacterium]